MPSLKFSTGHSFLLGIMALMVAALCLTLRVAQENIEARIIMAVIWIAIAITWLVIAAKNKKSDS